jgi:hypothetical protein
MFDLIFWTVILVLNIYFGIRDVKSKKPANWSVALTWIAVGVSALELAWSIKALI